MTLGDLLKRSGKLIADNSPAIMTALGVTGALTTAYLTGKASFKASKYLRHEQELNDIVRGGPSTFKEKAQLTWKLYIPAALSGAATVAVIIGANRVGSRRAAALAAAYSLTERAFEQYKEKVVATIGAKKEQGIQDVINQERLINDPISSKEVIVISGEEALCYDAFSGRYFTSAVETLRKAENDTNRQIIHDGYASLTDLYYRIGLRPTSMSDEVGWTSDVVLELKFSPALTDDNRPCLAINFTAGPVRNYHKFS